MQNDLLEVTQLSKFLRQNPNSALCTANSTWEMEGLNFPKQRCLIS